jgi:hypothetical protein
MTAHETTDHHHDQHDHHEESFTITVKTLAGHKLPVEVIDSELVAAVAVEATIEFRAKRELADDGADYMLSLPRLGPEGKLDPSSTLVAAGIHAGDELLLISRAPHVDG